MPQLIRAVAIIMVLVGVVLIGLGASLAAVSAGGGGSSGAACVIILFIPICFSWGSNAAAVGIVAAVVSLTILVIAVILLRRFVEGMAPGE